MPGLLQAVRGLFGGGAAPGGNNGSTPPAGSGSNNAGSVDAAGALEFVQDKWNDLKNAYVVIHQSIWQSLLFYANQSWIDWDDARKVWQPQVASDDWVPRPRINRFSPTMDAVISNFATLPEVQAVPKKQDNPTAHIVAEVCNDLVDYFVVKEGLKHQQNDQEDKVGLAAQLFVLEGGVFTVLRLRKNSLGQQAKQAIQPATGYQCDVCDKYTQLPQPMVDPQGAPGAAGEVPTNAPKFCPDCGNPVTPQDTEMMQPQMDELGQPQMDDVTENEVSMEIGNMLYAFPRAGSTSLDDSPFFLWAQRRTLDDIFFQFDKFEASPDAIWPDGYSVTYEHALNFWYTGYSSSSLQVKDSCMVLEMYVPPNKVKDHAEGFYCAVINDQAAKTETWDYPAHPFTMGKYLTLPTIFFPRATAFDCVEIQRENNAYESLIKLHAMVSASDSIVVEADSIVSEITGRADKIIKWRRVTPESKEPHRMAAGALDEGVYKQRESLHSEFQNISMAVNAVRGQQEGAITAASAIQQLRSQAELMFSKPAANWRYFWRDSLRKAVLFLQKYYTFEQLAKILGDDREEEIRAFLSADLDDTVDWVASDHGLPRTKDELRQEMMTMFDKGALDINDPAVRQRAYELFGETGMMQSFNKDATNARLENQMFKMGAAQSSMQPYVAPQITPMHPPLEDNSVHLYFHADQVKSQDFKKWKPEAKQALIEHVMKTQMLMEPIPTPGAPGAQPGAAPTQLGGPQTTQGQNPAVAKPTPVAAV